MFTKILSTACYVPETRRTNTDLEKMVDTTDAWITERVGIKERRITQQFETHKYMALHAVKSAIEKAGINPAGASIILTGNTHVPDVIPCHASETAAQMAGTAAWDIIAPTSSIAAMDANLLFGSYILLSKNGMITGKTDGKCALIYHHVRPSLAQTIAKELGMNADLSYDLVAGCASFNFGLALADARIQGKSQYVVVAAVDKMLDVTNPKDRATVVLFGELAGAAVLGPSKEAGFVYHHLETDGTQRNLITVKKENGWDKPYFWQDGKAVYKWAVPKIAELTQKTVDTAIADITPGRVFIVPHQANPRMLEKAREKPIFEKVHGIVTTGEMFGNSSTASIAHALDIALTHGFQSKNSQTCAGKHDYIGIIGFGAGLSSAVNVYRVV
ncbi:MAG: 3-oxoacyl-[acyl-carrier-protein] synthase III C-terminal domain-containing protein [Candidatus Woesearchaeota archaeon]